MVSLKNQTQESRAKAQRRKENSLSSFASLRLGVKLFLKLTHYLPDLKFQIFPVTCMRFDERNR